jgi:hypothetical protein
MLLPYSGVASFLPPLNPPSQQSQSSRPALDSPAEWSLERVPQHTDSFKISTKSSAPPTASKPNTKPSPPSLFKHGASGTTNSPRQLHSRRVWSLPVSSSSTMETSPSPTPVFYRPSKMPPSRTWKLLDTETPSSSLLTNGT